jgi:hypothetical protein
VKSVGGATRWKGKRTILQRAGAGRQGEISGGDLGHGALRQLREEVSILVLLEAALQHFHRHGKAIGSGTVGEQLKKIVQAALAQQKI